MKKAHFELNFHVACLFFKRSFLRYTKRGMQKGEHGSFSHINRQQSTSTMREVINFYIQKMVIYVHELEITPFAFVQSVVSLGYFCMEFIFGAVQRTAWWKLGT